MNDVTLEFHPLTAERWADLETLFGERGAFGGCWCMWWRLKRAEFSRQTGEGNKQAFKSIVDAGNIPGILAYAGGGPVGWCSIAPREDFPTLQRSRTLKPVDDQPVWSIACFFIAKPYRGSGMMRRLVQAAIAHAKEHGAKIVEAYPQEPREGSDAWSGFDGFMGLLPVFHRAGFVEVLRRSERQPIMRYYIED